MTEEVKHYQINGRYRIVIERAASTKGVVGVKVESNSDSIDDAIKDAQTLFTGAVLFADKTGGEQNG